MILEEVVNFLKKEPPFQFLDDAALRSVADSLSIEFYPKDTVILKQDGPPSVFPQGHQEGGCKGLHEIGKWETRSRWITRGKGITSASHP